MNKKEFNTILNKALEGLTLEKQMAVLNKIKDEYIIDYINQKFKRYRFCDTCGKYSLVRDFRTISEKETKVGITHTDAGYGDDDRYGEVEYIIDYLICPICGSKKERVKHFLRTLWEKGR